MMTTMSFSFKKFTFIISLLLLQSPVAFSLYNKASFIHPASPKSHSSVDSVATGYGLFDNMRNKSTNKVRRKDSTNLFSKKKKKVAGSAGSTKIQVKLLKDIAGTGQTGSVIMVTPAFFNNKLRPTRSARMVSDEEVAAERSQSAAAEQSVLVAERELQDALADTMVVIKRKAGPEGHLFGGIGPKIIMNALSEKHPNELWKKNKKIKVQELSDAVNEKIIKGDIKEIGNFIAKIKISDDIVSKVGISIEKEA